VVIANGAESEPASRKDEILLRAAPHLVRPGRSVTAWHPPLQPGAGVRGTLVGWPEP
jgi:hypothetical protein